ncbi:MAG: hypothetical protein LUE27_10155 [Clostridia bacterium]|nr:hypothetical protein [Clostridia bacterium]
MNEYQLYAGKFGAMIRSDRHSPRDLFDVYEYTKSPMLNRDLLHQCLIFDECISGTERIKDLCNPDWNNISKITDTSVGTQLTPLMKGKSTFDLDSAVKTVTDFLKPLFNMTDNEKEFVEKYKNHYYDPTLLFESADMAVRIGWHPGAFSFCQNTWVSREDAITMAKSLEYCGEYKIKGLKALELFNAARNRNRKGFIFYRLFYGCSVSNSREDDERMLLSQLVMASKSNKDIDVIYDVFKCSALHDEAKSQEYYKTIIKEELKKKSALKSKDNGAHFRDISNRMDNGKDDYKDKDR